MSKRYIVTITDTEGTIWLNTGSFELPQSSSEYLLWFVSMAISRAKDHAKNWCFYSGKQYGN